MNGRTSLSRYPPAFGHGPDIIAREFRKALAGDLPDHAAVTEAVPALQWLLENDVLVSTRQHAMDALCRLASPEADQLLLTLLKQPHPQGAIVVRALEEAGKRNLQAARSLLPVLAVHFRSDVPPGRKNARRTMAGERPAPFRSAGGDNPL